MIQDADTELLTAIAAYDGGDATDLLSRAVNRLEQLSDMGCEMCDHMITDTIEESEDPEFHGRPAYSWVCGACWNPAMEELTRLGGCEPMLRNFCSIWEAAVLEEAQTFPGITDLRPTHRVGDNFYAAVKRYFEGS